MADPTGTAQSAPDPTVATPVPTSAGPGVFSNFPSVEQINQATQSPPTINIDPNAPPAARIAQATKQGGVPVFLQDGTAGYVHNSYVQQFLKDNPGSQRGVFMTAPDGTPGRVPMDQAGQLQQQGFKAGLPNQTVWDPNASRFASWQNFVDAQRQAVEKGANVWGGLGIVPYLAKSLTLDSAQAAAREAAQYIGAEGQDPSNPEWYRNYVAPAAQASAQFLESNYDPKQLAMLVALGGANKLNNPLARTALRGLQSYFALQQAHGAYQEGSQAAQAFAQGNTAEGVRHLTSGAYNTGMAADIAGQTAEDFANNPQAIGDLQQITAGPRKAIGTAIDPLSQMTPAQIAIRGTKATSTIPDIQAKVDLALPYARAGAEKLGIDVDQMGRDPDNPVAHAEGLAATRQAKTDVWDELQANHLGPAGSFIRDMTPVADRIQSVLDDMTDVKKRRNPGLVDQMNQAITDYDGQQKPVQWMEQRLEELNNELYSEQSRLKVNQDTLRKDPAYAFQFAELEGLRSELNNALDSITGPGARQLKAVYGGLKTLETIIERSRGVAERPSPEGLFGGLGKLAGVPNILGGGVRTLAGDLHGGVPQLAKGAAEIYMGRRGQQLNNRNYLLGEAFRRSEPATFPQRQPFVPPAPSAAGPPMTFPPIPGTPGAPPPRTPGGGIPAPASSLAPQEQLGPAPMEGRPALPPAGGFQMPASSVPPVEQGQLPAGPAAPQELTGEGVPSRQPQLGTGARETPRGLLGPARLPASISGERAAAEAAAARGTNLPAWTNLGQPKGETLYNRLGNESEQPIGAQDPREQQRAAADAVSRRGIAPGRVGDVSYAYTRRSGGDDPGLRVLGVPTLESWSLDPQAVQALQAKGHQSPDVHELDYTHPDAAQTFHDQIAQTKVGNPYAASVHVYSPEEYAGTRMFLSSDGKAGFALRPDGDIISLFTHGDGPKGASHTMLEIAKQAGGTKLDAFDTILPRLYGQHGFTAVARLPWNDEYAPEGWNKNTFAKFNNGEPDVVFMARDANAVPYQAGDGAQATDYDGAARLQQQAVNRFAQGGGEPLRAYGTAEAVKQQATLDALRNMNSTIDEGGPDRAAAIHLDDAAATALQNMGIGGGDRWRGINLQGEDGRSIANQLRQRADAAEQAGNNEPAIVRNVRNLADQIDRVYQLNYDPNAGHAGVPFVHDPVTVQHEAAVHGGQRAFAGGQGDIRQFTDAEATINHPAAAKAIPALIDSGYSNHPAVLSAELQAHILDGNVAKLGLSPEEAIDFIKHSKDVLARFHGPEKMENVPRLAQRYIDALDQFTGARRGEPTAAATPEAAQQAGAGTEHGANAPLGENAEGAGGQGNRGVGPLEEQVGPSLAARRISPRDKEADALRVSTRNPTAGKDRENPLTENLQINTQAIRNSGLAEKIADKVAQYPGMNLSGDTESVLKGFLDHAVSNLLWLHDQFPKALRDQAKQWYDGANKLANKWSGDYGATPSQVAGVIASQSPQKDWHMNVSLAQRILDIFQRRNELPYSPEMADKAQELGTDARTEALKEAAKEEAKGNTAKAERLRASADNTRIALEDIAGKNWSQLQTATQKGWWIRLHDEAHNSRNYNVYAPDGSVSGLARTGKGKLKDVAWGSTPAIAKAVSMLEDGSRANISKQLGNAHKIRSFYNNIIAPNSKSGDVTIDTHAVAANLLRALSGKSTEVTQNFGGTGSKITGVAGAYGLHADAYRIAAEKLGILPRELQSITWEAVRSLFTPEFKRGAGKAIIDNIWKEHTGDIGQTRQAIVDAVAKAKNGDAFTAPSWASGGSGPAAGGNEAPASAANTGVVSGPGVSGQGAGRAVGGGRSRVAGAVPVIGEGVPRAGGSAPRRGGGVAASPIPTPLRRVVRK